MTEEDMQRTLVAEFGGIEVQWDNTNNVYVENVGGAGYEQISSGLFVLQSDLDLSGYALKRKTFYPYSSFEQRGQVTSGQFTASPTYQPYVFDHTLLSTVPLTAEDIALLATRVAPGFNPPSLGITTGAGRFTRDVITHGDSKVYTIDSTLSVAGGYNTLRLIDNYNYSSLEPTAADKIYCYRILVILGVAGEVLKVNLPASRVLLPGTISSEPKLEYMMRLKRSYELANQV
jgi:hypothetical protein